MYDCKRCGHECHQMSNLKYHLNRKLPCENILNCEKSTIELLDDLKENRSGDEYKYSCQLCDKQFKRSSNLSQHKHYCKVIKNKEKDDEIAKLKAELESLKKNTLIETTNDTTSNNPSTSATTSNTINITNITNITQPNINITINKLIIVNNFGSEDISHIVNNIEFLDKCMSSITRGLPIIIEKIYYDKDKPENHNVFIKSIKRKSGIIYENNEWKEQNLNRIIPVMIMNGSNILQQHLESKHNVEYDVNDPEKMEFKTYKSKQLYLSSILQQKNPEFNKASSAVKTIIEIHRKS